MHDAAWTSLLVHVDAWVTGESPCVGDAALTDSIGSIFEDVKCTTDPVLGPIPGPYGITECSVGKAPPSMLKGAESINLACLSSTLQVDSHELGC